MEILKEFYVITNGQQFEHDNRTFWRITTDIQECRRFDSETEALNHLKNANQCTEMFNGFLVKKVIVKFIL